MKKTSVNKKTIIFFLIIILLFITISIILVLQNKSKVDFSAYISEGNIFVFDPINNKQKTKLSLE